MRPSDKSKRLRTSGFHWALLEVFMHLLAVLLVAVLMAWIVIPARGVLALAQYTVTVPDLLSMSLWRIALHACLAGCIWALMVIIYRLWQLRRTVTVYRSFRTARGTIMTETLVVLPTFFLLTFGLAQLSVNNMAGILSNVAVYEAARAIWVWAPESQISEARAGEKVTADMARDRARIAAALVMTPVAPGQFITDGTGVTQAFRNQRRVQALSQVPLGGTISDYISFDIDIAEDLLLAFAAPPTQGYLSLTRALDTDMFIERGFRKMSHAYLATDIEIKSEGNRLGAKLTYKHNQVFPVVGRVFAPVSLTGTPGGRPGRYMTIEREYTFRKQEWLPNHELPNNEPKDGQPVEGTDLEEADPKNVPPDFEG